MSGNATAASRIGDSLQRPRRHHLSGAGVRRVLARGLVGGGRNCSRAARWTSHKIDAVRTAGGFATSWALPMALALTICLVWMCVAGSQWVAR